MSAYVCSEHTTEPVTWKGTGCRLCRRHAHRQPMDPGYDAATWHQWRGAPIEPSESDR